MFRDSSNVLRPSFWIDIGAVNPILHITRDGLSRCTRAQETKRCFPTFYSTKKHGRRVSLRTQIDYQNIFSGMSSCVFTRDLEGKVAFAYTSFIVPQGVDCHWSVFGLLLRPEL